VLLHTSLSDGLLDFANLSQSMSVLDEFKKLDFFTALNNLPASGKCSAPKQVQVHDNVKKQPKSF